MLNTFPALIIQILLTLLLAFLTFTTLLKALELSRKENIEFAAKQDQLLQNGGNDVMSEVEEVPHIK